MINPLYQQYGGTPQMTGAMGNLQNIMQRFQQFRQTFNGDPRQQVQNLLNSGRVTQQQYNEAVQIAQQMQRMMGK